MTKVRIVLAEDHQVVREGLRMVLDREASMEVVGEADDGLAATRLTRELEPDLVVMDVSMPNLNGLEATEAIRTSQPGTKILILTRHADRCYVSRLLRAGAHGYVLKQSAAEELVRAIKRVAAGQKYLDPAVTEQAVGTITPGRDHAGSRGRCLSAREEDVLRLVARGFLAREIAPRLNISVKTVETHKMNAMVKMGMKSRIDIVRYAMLQRWLQEN